MSVVRLLALVAMLAVLPVVADAQTFPNKPVTVVVPFVPGGSNDLLGRFLANGLSKLWGQTVVVENRGGGGTAVGSAHVAQSKPDGYTFLVVSGTITANAAIQPNPQFDPVRDLASVGMVASTPVFLLGGPKLQADNLQGMVKEGKSRVLFNATAGVGSLPHFGGALLAAETGIRVENLHFKGGGEIQQDLIGGRADLVFANAPFALTALQSKGVKALAVTGSQRFSKLPNVPTLTESGLEKADFSSWWGVFVPAATPPAIIDQLNKAIAQVMTSKDAATFLEQQGAAFTPTTPAEFKKLTTDEYAKWSKLAKESKMSSQ